MGNHINTEGQFQSDRHPHLPENQVILSADDSAADSALEINGWAIPEGSKIILRFSSDEHREIIKDYAETPDHSREIEFTDDLRDVLSRWNRETGRADPPEKD